MSQIPVQRKRRGLPWWAWLLIALALAALLWFLFDLFNRDPDEANDLNADVPIASVEPAASIDVGADGASPATVSPIAEGVASQEAGVGSNVTIAEIAANPAAYFGQTVTVRGPIEEVISPSAFSLDEDAAIGGGIDNDVLVVGTQQELPGLDAQLEGAQVEVTGVVRQVDLPALEQELGYDLDDALFGEYASRPAIVAQSVQILEGVPAAAASPAADVAASTAPEASRAAATGASPAPETLFDITAVLNAPDRTQFAGQPVQFPDVYVQSVPGDKVFFVGPAPDRALPVLLNEQQTPGTPTEGRVDVNPGQTVTVVGTLRPLPITDDVRQLVSLTPADEAALSGQQVFVFAQRVIVNNQ